VLNLLTLAASIGFGAAAAALCLQRWRREHHRVFAGLISVSVTSILFSGVAWGATEIAQIATLPFAWIAFGILAFLFGVRLYRQLQAPPQSEARRSSRLEQSDKPIGKRR